MKKEAENQDKEQDSFSSLEEEDQIGIVREFIEYIRENKKYWLIPLLAILLVLGLLLLGGSSPLAPFIYTLF